MHPFLERYAADVFGMLSDFDRLRLRGTLRRIANAQGMATFLSQQHVLFKDFGEYVHDVTTRVKQASEAVALAQGRPVLYLPAPRPTRRRRPARSPPATGSRRG